MEKITRFEWENEGAGRIRVFIEEPINSDFAEISAEWERLKSERKGLRNRIAEFRTKMIVLCKDLGLTKTDLIKRIESLVDLDSFEI